MKKIYLLIIILFTSSLLNGCISNENIRINVKSSHTWSLDIEISLKIWENYSMIQSNPIFNYSEIKKLYVNEIDLFDIKIKTDKIGYVEIIINASTRDGFYDEYELYSFDLEKDYYFDIIGSGNEVKIIKSI